MPITTSIKQRTLAKARGLLRPLARLRRDKRGNVAIAVAALMPIIVGFGGMALDTIQWIELKQKLQRASDSAAIAGSLIIWAIAKSRRPVEPGFQDQLRAIAPDERSRPLRQPNNRRIHLLQHRVHI